MVRNQVYLREDQDRELRLMVATGGGVYSELIRKGVDMIIKDRNKKKKKNNFDSWRDFIGKGGLGGPKDLSKNIDYYLYEEPYENKKK